MTTYELTSIPNQEVTITVNGYVCDFRLHTFRDILYSSVSIDGQKVADGIRCVPNGWLIPTIRVDAEVGNFRFETNAGNYPNYEDFDGGTCVLVHYTQEEVESLNG